MLSLRVAECLPVSADEGALLARLALDLTDACSEYCHFVPERSPPWQTPLLSEKQRTEQKNKGWIPGIKTR